MELLSFSAMFRELARVQSNFRKPPAHCTVKEFQVSMPNCVNPRERESMLQDRYSFTNVSQSAPSRFLRHFSPLLLALLSCLVLALAASAGQLTTPQDGPNRLELSYTLEMERPSTHLLQVEISVAKVEVPVLRFAMPVWAPGRYAIYDFAKNVQEFTVVGANGQALPWVQPDKQTWAVNTSDCGGTVKVLYKVFANDLTGSFSQFDTSHGAINGASVFMYLPGNKPDPLTLTIHPPHGWKIVSGFSMSPSQTTFQVPNYDVLIDTPLEIGPDCWVKDFEEDGKTFRVAVHSYPDQDGDADNRSALVEGLKKIVHSEMAMMPAPDFNHYTFLFHFDPGLPMGDGMEHLNSTDIIVHGKLSDSGLSQALETAAHEFFHLWNVKRLRPTGLGPFDYSREAYTRSLWFVEGITTYYSYVNLLRSGIWSQQEFLDRLAGEVRALREAPGRRLMSAESSSFHAWFFDRSPQMQETNFANTTISYYNKGALLGTLLDLEIRSATRGEKSLDDVMRLMYGKFYAIPAASYYLRGHGYTEMGILDAVNQVSGTDFTSFFQQYVAGTVPLPYNEVLARAGLALHVATSPQAPPSLGVLVEPVDTGVRILAVQPGGAADRAGLSRDDVLISVDDQSLATQSLADRLSIYTAGAKVPFEVERHENRLFITVQLDPPRPDEYSIMELPGATNEQARIRQGWLNASQQGPAQSSPAGATAGRFRNPTSS
ncbi:MAG TPA: PDZ domain-containing protein [Terriglobia bacterium]|nr:PDZ domain-containing protein [Terriglobia bacterium]